ARILIVLTNSQPRTIIDSPTRKRAAVNAETRTANARHTKRNVTMNAPFSPAFTLYAPAPVVGSRMIYPVATAPPREISRSWTKYGTARAIAAKELNWLA